MRSVHIGAVTPRAGASMVKRPHISVAYLQYGGFY